MSNRVLLWNDDKPHRCPKCHAVTDENNVARWAVVTCCRCGTRFSRLPWLSLLLPKRGIVCAEWAIANELTNEPQWDETHCCACEAVNGQCRVCGKRVSHD